MSLSSRRLFAFVVSSALVGVLYVQRAPLVNGAQKSPGQVKSTTKPGSKSASKSDGKPEKRPSRNAVKKPVTELVKYNVSAPYVAPELRELQNWVNSKPLTLASLRGKVVLINFWTFQCINCQRTLPYVNEYYKTFHDQGFEVLGIHAPEFDSERDAANVAKAVKREGITFPVAQDNDFKTWLAYQNRFWPAFYFIDKKGVVRHTHFGEGRYDQNAKIIAQLLVEPA
jgi:thiol-disulfide isomerase/thioredoxin